MSKLSVCANCKHLKRDHIYEEGACRPGFQCLARCDKFVYEELDPIEQALNKEREACAAMIEEMGKSIKGGYNNAAHEMAQAIRNRSTDKPTEYVPDLSIDPKTGIITVNREGVYYFSGEALVRIKK